MKKLLSLFFLLTLSLAVGAQTRLSGKVVDFRTGEVIPLANVVRLGEKKNYVVGKSPSLFCAFAWNP